jgi:hypothetical protein
MSKGKLTLSSERDDSPGLCKLCEGPKEDRGAHICDSCFQLEKLIKDRRALLNEIAAREEIQARLIAERDAAERAALAPTERERELEASWTSSCQAYNEDADEDACTYCSGEHCHYHAGQPCDCATDERHPAAPDTTSGATRPEEDRTRT